MKKNVDEPDSIGRYYSNAAMRALEISRELTKHVDESHPGNWSAFHTCLRCKRLRQQLESARYVGD